MHEMENSAFTTHAEILLRIAELKAEKLTREDYLKHTLNEFVYALNPVSIVKKSLHGFVTDKQVQVDLAKAGLNVGANFIIDQALGRYRSVRGFVSSVLVEKFSPAFINNNISKIFSGIISLVRKKPEQKSVNGEFIIKQKEKI